MVSGEEVTGIEVRCSIPTYEQRGVTELQQACADGVDF